MPLDPSAVWPSAAWAAQLGDRADGKAVRNERAPWPDWWLLMAGRGDPVTPEERAALQEAHRIITAFTGYELDRAAVLLTRDAVRDALFAAPRPVTPSWVRAALSIASRVAQWCADTGQPVTREHVFGEETIHRWLHAGPGTDLSDGSVKTYRARLTAIADALLNPPEHLVPRVPGVRSEYLAPLATEEEVALWAWSRGLRPETRRQRVQAILTLGFGVGARRSDMHGTRARDVTRDDHGVHVHLRPSPNSPFHPRTVTCLQDWEDRLWRVAQTTPPDHLLIAPWRPHLADLQSFDETVRAAPVFGAPAPIAPAYLRNTWLVRHLTAGTPLPILMAAADITTVKLLTTLLDHVPQATPGGISAALRQARP